MTSEHSSTTVTIDSAEKNGNVGPSEANQQQQQPFAFRAMVEALGLTTAASGPVNANTNEQCDDDVELDEASIQKIELYCKQVYESSDPKQRQEAENAIIAIGNSPSCLKVSQLLIERNSSPYAQLLGTQSLTQFMEKRSGNLGLYQKRKLRNFAITYLASSSNLAPYVVQSLTKLFAQITKLIWFDVCDQQGILYLIREQFMQRDSIEHHIIGIIVLTQVIQEINHVNYDPMVHRSITRQRRVATNFRDDHLVDIFSFSTSLLKQSYSMIKANDCSQDRLKLTEVCLKLTLACLSFDFIGTSPDESNSDDLPTVQIPSTWRKLFVEEETMDLFFNLYHILPANIACHAISCLVQWTSVRRSIFTSFERFNFLEKVLKGIQAIVENPSNLTDSLTYHEFCRLLVRFKSNFQLTELSKTTVYPKWIVLMKDFTIHAFRGWNSSPNSIHYLLMFWQKMVSSSNYCKGTFDHYLDQNAPEIFRAYVTSRLEYVNNIVHEGLDDPLEDTPMLHQQLEQLAHIARQKFRENAQFLTNAFEETAKQFTTLIGSRDFQSTDMQIIIGRLTWLVYLLGAATSGRIYIRSEREDEIEGELACLVFKLIQITDGHLRYNNFRNETLELAFLDFLEVYRKCHVWDHSGRVHKRLVELLGLPDDSSIYSFYITKIITNLNFWSSSEAILRETLSIFHEFSQSFSRTHSLFDLKEIQFMLSNHNSDNFPFLSNNTTIEFMQHRTSFYSSLVRHLIENMRLGNEDQFDEFVAPLDNAFEQLRKAIMENPEANVVQNEEVKRAFIGICRDVRGITKEFTKPLLYPLLFEWLYPKYTAVIKKGLEIWFNDPQATTPALRLVSELIDHKEKRYNDSVSPESIYLFREVSSLVVCFGARLLTLTDLNGDKAVENKLKYQFKLKAVSLVFKIIQFSLRAKINFAVFQLYGDPALNDLLHMFVKLFLSIYSCDIIVSIL